MTDTGHSRSARSALGGMPQRFVLSVRSISTGERLGSYSGTSRVRGARELRGDPLTRVALPRRHCVGPTHAPPPRAPATPRPPRTRHIACSDAAAAGVTRCHVVQRTKSSVDNPE